MIDATTESRIESFMASPDSVRALEGELDALVIEDPVREIASIPNLTPQKVVASINSEFPREPIVEA